MKAKMTRTFVAAVGALAAAAAAVVVAVGGTEGRTNDMADWNWGSVPTAPVATEPAPEDSAAFDPNWG